MPLFQGLVREGAKSLPITDPRMTRFWITLDQAEALFAMAGQDFDALSAKVEQEPLPTKDAARPLGPGGLGWAVASALYDRANGWPALAAALAADREGGCHCE